MAWQDVAAKIVQGAAGAAGNTNAQAEVGAWQQRRQGLEDEQRQLRQSELDRKAASGAITPVQWGSATSDLYAHEPAESRLGRLKRGAERIVGMKKQADAQKQQADAKLAAQPSPKADYVSIQASAKTPDQLAAEKAQATTEAGIAGSTAKWQAYQKLAEGLPPEKQAQLAQLFGVKPQAMTADVQKRADFAAFKQAHPEYNGSYEQWVTEQAATGKAAAPMTPYQQAQDTYKKAALALAQAKLDASKDPNNPATKAALERANAEERKAFSYVQRGYATTLGTTPSGQPLPGANVDATGRPIGSAFSGNVKPTGQEIGRADLATSTLEQIGNVRSILSSRPDLFGPAAGREVNFTQWLGTQDPDAQKFKAAIDTIASHLSGVYGARGAYSQSAIADTIGRNRTNPAAISAALDQYEKAAKTIQERGTRRTVGGVPQNAPAPRAAQGGGGKYKVGDTIVQGGHKFKATAVDQNGKVTAANPVQ